MKYVYIQINACAKMRYAKKFLKKEGMEYSIFLTHFFNLVKN